MHSMMQQCCAPRKHHYTPGAQGHTAVVHKQHAIVQPGNNDAQPLCTANAPLCTCCSMVDVVGNSVRPLHTMVLQSNPLHNCAWPLGTTKNRFVPDSQWCTPLSTRLTRCSQYNCVYPVHNGAVVTTRALLCTQLSAPPIPLSSSCSNSARPLCTANMAWCNRYNNGARPLRTTTLPVCTRCTLAHDCCPQWSATGASGIVHNHGAPGAQWCTTRHCESGAQCASDAQQWMAVGTTKRPSCGQCTVVHDRCAAPQYHTRCWLRAIKQPLCTCCAPARTAS